MYQLVVTGKSFLWHQVRCMAAILFLVGSGLEQPSVINHMLEGKRKPQYGMAAGETITSIMYDLVIVYIDIM